MSVFKLTVTDKNYVAIKDEPLYLFEGRPSYKQVEEALQKKGVSPSDSVLEQVLDKGHAYTSDMAFFLSELNLVKGEGE